MGKIIAVVNQKGGVGKTTSTVNLTAALHDLGVKVLLCDFDPQANATSGMGVDKRKIKHSIYDVTINGVPAKNAIVSTKYGDVLPASSDLAGATVELITTDHRERQLDAALKAADVTLQKFFAPPSETNFGGGLLSGTQSACNAACAAFAEAVTAVAEKSLEK